MKLFLVQTLEELKTVDFGLCLVLGFFWQEVNNCLQSVGGWKYWKKQISDFSLDKKRFGLFNTFSFCVIRCLMVISDNSS